MATNAKPGWFDFSRVGQYPVEYNAKVHGPYDPARWYGKPDTNIWDVKLGDMGAWVARRNKDPISIAQGVGRWWWRWQHRWQQPYRAGAAGYFQFAFWLSFFFYVNNYGKYRRHRWYKYHW